MTRASGSRLPASGYGPESARAHGERAPGSARESPRGEGDMEASASIPPSASTETSASSPETPAGPEQLDEEQVSGPRAGSLEAGRPRPCESRIPRAGSAPVWTPSGLRVARSRCPPLSRCLKQPARRPPPPALRPGSLELIFFFLMAAPRGSRGSSSPTRDETHAICSVSSES